MKLFIVVGGCHIIVIFLFGQDICLFIEGWIELWDFLFVNFHLLLQFLVILSQELYVILHVGLVYCLVVKECVKLPELGFEGPEFLVWLFTNLLIFGNLLKETFSFCLDAFNLSFQSGNILVKHLDLFGWWITHCLIFLIGIVNVKGKINAKLFEQKD